MKTTDPWHFLRTGEVTQGLKAFKRIHDREPTASHIMELGVAYLWIRQYEEAWGLFRKTIDEYPQSMSSFYGMAGTAKWCLGDTAEAVRQWRDGLESKYADTNGLGLHLPLLLFAASILRPGSFENKVALKLLRDKSRDHRINEWPGPIALLVLGEINESDLRNQCSPADQVLTNDRKWLTTFYEGVLSYRVGNEAESKRAMQRLADTSSPLWTDQDFFLARMWSEEFFLARHELV